MKSLQEIWDKIGTLENQLTQTQLQLGETRAENRLLVGLMSTSTVDLAWQITTVDAAGDVGFSSSLAFGPDGQPAISYHETFDYEDEDIHSLKFARFSGSAWAATTLHSDIGQWVGNTSLAFGPNGQPAISYFFFFGNGIFLTGPSSGSEYGSKEYSSLAFGPGGQPAFSFLDSSRRLNLSRFDGNAWASTMVDTSATVDGEHALAFGPDGHPGIAYIGDGDLKFARFNGSNWTSSVVDSAGTAYSSLAFGPNGQPAISYYDGTNGDLKFARFDGTMWIVSTVDSAGNVGSYSSLAFGPDGQPAIAYIGGGDLKFARFNGSNWTSSVVDPAGTADSSLAFGPDGQPAISYYDGTTGDLKFARKGIFKAAP